MPTKKIKILLLEAIHEGAKLKLEEQGFEVHREESSYHGKELVELAAEFDGIGIRSKTKLTADVLEKLPNLKFVGCFCIGTNQVDLDRANQLGIPVFNAPYSNTRSVAELVIAEMIALSRKLGDRSKNAHEGIWTKSASGSNEVRGKTLGIVGYGHIGSQLSILSEALGLNVIYYDVVKKLPLGNAKPCDSFEELLKASDFVSFHVPETPQTKLMMQKEQINLMRKGSYLINASRGSVVNIQDLAAAIECGYLAGAAVDVFPKEPANNDEKFTSELQGLPNVILTPHIGGSTKEAQYAIGQEVAESAIRFFGLGATLGAVNFPHLDVPPVKDAPRILNVHHNRPGVLGEINSIISKLGGNIQSQYLSTDPQIGYVVLDIGGGSAQEAYDQICKLPSSIKTTILDR